MFLLQQVGSGGLLTPLVISCGFLFNYFFHVWGSKVGIKTFGSETKKRRIVSIVTRLSVVNNRTENRTHYTFTQKKFVLKYKIPSNKTVHTFIS